MLTRKEYDAKGQQTASVDARTRRTVVEYDALGRQTAIIDARKNRTEMTYDAIGQLLSRRDALNNVERFTYDKVGNQTARRDGRGQLTTYAYDALNRLVSEQLTGEAAITFTYDAMGQQLTMTDASGTTTNTYDALGRVLSETNGRGNRLAYEYDVAGRRTAMVDPENGRTLYAYDANGWLTQLTDPQQGVTTYSYDKLGRELTKTLPNGVVSSHVYNQVGDETLLEERDVSGTLLNSYVSTYNKVGMKLSVTEQDGSVVSYRYYPDNSLSREERVGSSPYVREYFYDAAGNLLRRVRDGLENVAVLDKANQIVSKTGPSGTVNFFYDADGNLSRQSNPDGSGTSYFFDGRDQLSAVEMKKAGGALSHRSEFLYDGFGRLVKSREFVRQNNAWVGQSERGRVFDGMDTVQERGAADQVLGQLTRDGNIGGILSRKAGAETTFFSYDGNGNVTLLSDAQGNSVGRYRYDGFGNALEVSGSAANQNSHRFSTKELHAPSGLYYYGFRFYSTALGRWINRDPIGELGGVNLYRMAENNLINKVDLLGLATDPQPGSDNIRFVFEAFIPTKYVNAPGVNNPLFGRGLGDNRGFRSDGGSFRVSHTIVLNPKTGGFTSWEELGVSHVTGTLFGLAGDLVLEGQNQKSLQTYINSDGCGGWNIHIEGNSRNGFSFGAPLPGITYRIQMNVSSNGAVYGKIGKLDGYPAYELWRYMPDKSPLSLGYYPSFNSTVKADTIPTLIFGYIPAKNISVLNLLPDSRAVPWGK